MKNHNSTYFLLVQCLFISMSHAPTSRKLLQSLESRTYIRKVTEFTGNARNNSAGVPLNKVIHPSFFAIAVIVWNVPSLYLEKIAVWFRSLRFIQPSWYSYLQLSMVLEEEKLHGCATLVIKTLVIAFCISYLVASRIYNQNTLPAPKQALN